MAGNYEETSLATISSSAQHSAPIPASPSTEVNAITKRMQLTEATHPCN